MCRSELSKLESRLKSDSLRISSKERHRLTKIYKVFPTQELSKRSLHRSGIDRESFIRFTELPGLFGEQFFSALDTSNDNKLDLEEFIQGMVTLYRGGLVDISLLLYRIFDMTNKGYVSVNDLRHVLTYLPRSCPKCLNCTHIPIDLDNQLEDLFNKSLVLDQSQFVSRIIQCKIWRVVIQALMNSLPFILDETMLPSISNNLPQNFFEVGTLEFYKKKRYFQLKNQAFYYSKEDNMHHAKVILIKDLFVEAVGTREFVLRNSRLSYSFKAESTVIRDNWVRIIKYSNNYSNFHDFYEISDFIGKGGFGTVKLALSKISGEKFAVKIISKKPLDELSETQIRREIDVLRLSSHPNLLHLAGIYEDADTLYIVTEYISGGSLQKYLSSNNFRIQEDKCKEIVLELASGLSYLHSIGIVHRDLKLDNILLDITPNKIRPIIIDYGLACILGPYQYAREAVGTLMFAAPEMLMGLPYRETVDVWALGLICYISLSGDIPFHGDDNQIVQSILAKPIDFKKKAWQEVSTQGKMIVASLLNRNPLQRLNLKELFRYDWESPQEGLHRHRTAVTGSG